MQLLRKNKNSDLTALKYSTTKIFLGLNKNEVMNDRLKHIQRLKKLKKMCSDEQEFLEMLFDNWDNLSFITAIEAEFKLDLMPLMKERFEIK